MCNCWILGYLIIRIKKCSTHLQVCILWYYENLHVKDSYTYPISAKKWKKEMSTPSPQTPNWRIIHPNIFLQKIFLIGSIHIITTVFIWYSQVWLWKTNWGGFDLADIFLTFNCHIMFIYQDSAFCCLWLSLWQALFIEKKVHIKLNMYACYHINYFKSQKTFLINV